LRLRKYTSTQVNLDELKKLSTQLKLSGAECGPQSNKSICQQIRKSKRALTAAKAKAQELRDEHMHERATLLAATHGM
jgi:cell division septum initiation protein DivIVA